MMPMKCEAHCGFGQDRKVVIRKEGNLIISTQSYWPQFTDRTTGKPYRYSFVPDCDMSDFSCGFYEIVYQNIFPNKRIVDSTNGNFIDKNFAGDTMTTVIKLPGLKENYHCLANFLLLPMSIGRTSRLTSIELRKWSKTSHFYPIHDFMDRFLILLKQNYSVYKELYPTYFQMIPTFERFVEIHMLQNSYIDTNGQIKQFSIEGKDITEMEKLVFEMIKKRERTIANSVYAKEQWTYFNQ